MATSRLFKARLSLLRSATFFSLLRTPPSSRSITQLAEFREEKDTFGPIKVPTDKYWAAQTQRSLQNFEIEGARERMPDQIVQAFGILKKSAAKVSKLRACRHFLFATRRPLSVTGETSVSSIDNGGLSFLPQATNSQAHSTLVRHVGSRSSGPAEFRTRVEQHCRWSTCNKFHDASFHLVSDNDAGYEEKVDPFSLVADELAVLANRLRSMVSTEVPKLASAAEYFFKTGVEGKRFRPMVLLLMASSMTAVLPIGASEISLQEQRLRQQRIAEITEMIHVASLLHDDVLDSADTRRGIGSLNFVMGNKLAVLAGDFLLSRASVALASLKNTEVVELLSKVLEHLVTGEIMQLTSNKEKSCNMEYYLEKTFYKTASLMANSCKAIALLAGQSGAVATLAYDYGRHLGMAFQLVDDMLDFTGTTASLGKGALSDIGQGIVTAPLLFALEQQPQLHDLIGRKFKNAGDVDLAVELLKRTDGIEKTRQLALDHASQAAGAIDALPPSPSERVIKCRKALVELTQQVITRTK